VATKATTVLEILPAHSSKEEYRAVLDAAPISVAHRWDLAARRKKFAKRWPDLGEWMQAPLPTRVGRLKGETRRTLTDPISYEARDYLYYLALTGRLRLDYEWLFAISVIWPGATASRLGIDLGVAAMTDRGLTLGYSDVTISMAARWLLPRLAMHAGIKHAREIRSEHLDEIQSAVDLFGDREDLELYHAPRPRFLRSASRTWSSYIWRARMILYHDGHVAHPPRKYHPGRPTPPGGPPAMQAVVARGQRQPVSPGNGLYTEDRAAPVPSAHSQDISGNHLVSRDHPTSCRGLSYGLGEAKAL